MSKSTWTTRWTCPYEKFCVSEACFSLIRIKSCHERIDFVKKPDQLKKKKNMTSQEWTKLQFQLPIFSHFEDFSRNKAKNVCNPTSNFKTNPRNALCIWWQFFPQKFPVPKPETTQSYIWTLRFMLSNTPSRKNICFPKPPCTKAGHHPKIIAKSVHLNPSFCHFICRHFNYAIPALIAIRKAMIRPPHPCS